MILTGRNLSVFVCAPCTLNCRLCCSSQPLYKERGLSYFHAVDKFKLELDEAFRIYDHVEKLTFTGGGEPLLHKQLSDMISYALQNYPSKFDKLRIVTNGTLLPGAELIEVIKRYSQKGNVEFLVDDYGAISDKVEIIKYTLSKNGISFVLYNYHGDAQHHNGWVDLGSLEQFRGYSEQEAKKIMECCHLANWRCIYIYDGKLFLCIRSVSGYALKCFDIPPDEYIDLLGDTQTLDQKKEIASSFGKEPIMACYYCNGWDPERSARFPGGEQVI